jgi:hypothetical protein
LEILISSENNIMIVEAAKGVMCVTSKHGENEHKIVLQLWSFEAKDLKQGRFWNPGLGAECGTQIPRTTLFEVLTLQVILKN